jgi:transcriptional regulator with XRE-family HTH domain
MAYRYDNTPAARRQRQRFAKALRAEILNRNLTITEAAARGGVTDRVLGRWLRAEGDPNPRVLKQFNAKLGIEHLPLVKALGWI